MENEIRILSLEDSAFDAELIERELRNAKMSFTMKRVETREDFVRAMDDFKPAVILLDYKLPSFDGMSALDIAREKCPHIPTIFVSGAIGEERAIETLKRGAIDYVMKDRLSRLVPAINRAIHEYVERKKLKNAEETIKENAQRFRTITETANDAIICIESPGVIYLWNTRAEEIFGYSAREAMGKDLHALVVPERYHEKAYQGLQAFFQSGKGAVIGKTIEMVALRKDGAEFPIEISIAAMNINGCWQATAIIRDITERKRVEEALKNSELRYHEIFDQITDYILVLEPVEDGYPRIIDTNENGILKHGYSRGELIGKPITFLDPEESKIPAHMDDFIRHGSARFEVIHKRKDGSMFQAEVFGKMINIGGKTLLYTIERDITERKESEEKLSQSYEKLRRTLEETAVALSSALEMRDAYTAGHQRRVTQLARAIASEMGLPEEQTDGIRIAGILHDIGKISIPAEILSKPGKLSKIEFELIKSHANAGYEILKDIEFPWPIAQIVLQHHEKMDGSGYPAGLLGDKILIEARILCVSDVVEAMASHRPYRAALGIDAAMEEITQKRGILYDPAVVDVCVRLFKEKGFKFE